VSVEVLRRYFGARRDGDMIAAFERHRTELEDVVKRIAEDAACGDLLITTQVLDGHASAEIEHCRQPNSSARWLATSAP
jgi:hypothetical protein